MNAVARKKGLGRGLEALLGGSADITEAVKINGAPHTLPLDKMQAVMLNDHLASCVPEKIKAGQKDQLVAELSELYALAQK